MSFNTPVSETTQTVIEQKWTASELTILDFIKWVDSMNPLSLIKLELNEAKLKDISDMQTIFKDFKGKFNIIEMQNQLLNNLVTERTFGNSAFETGKFALNLPNYIKSAEEPKEVLEAVQ